MKIFTNLVSFILFAISLNFCSLSHAADIEFFERSGCPHCADAKIFLKELQQEQPLLAIETHDIEKDAAALNQLQILAHQQNTQARVPAFYVREVLIVGYADASTTGQWLRSVLSKKTVQPLAQNDQAQSCDVEESVTCEVELNNKPEVFEVAFLGRKLTLNEIGLPLFTIVMGLLDGFNPCSMWVLILMISLLAPMQNRRRMLIVAGTFTLIEGLIYFLFMSAWLNLFLWIGLSRISEVIIALIALIAGVINIKDFYFFGKGLSLSISDSSKKNIYFRIRQVLNADNLVSALIGVAILAVLVQAVEFLCTSGFPALYTRILTLQHLKGFEYYGYLIIYNLAYMFDDLIVLTIGVLTMSQHRLQEKEGRWLKLMSGLAMVGLGLYLLV